VSVPFEMLSRSLDGFGVLASTSYTESGIDIKEVNSTIGKIPLPGLSRNVTNLTLYYEKAGFSTRVSTRKRSDYVGEIGNFAGDRQLRYVVGDSPVDFQIGYTFNEGTYKGLGVLLQVNNLTNEAYETYANSKDRQLEYAKYGRTVLFGELQVLSPSKDAGPKSGPALALRLACRAFLGALFSIPEGQHA
jgi:outer membrane receptor protein involved in Fe transport